MPFIETPLHTYYERASSSTGGGSFAASCGSELRLRVG